MSESKIDVLYGLINGLAMGCTNGDNELMILQEGLSACLKELDGNDEALTRVAAAVVSCIEDDVSGEEDTINEGDVEKLKSI